MTTYNIYHGWREIAPPDKIQRIYHGSRLIWERATGLIPDTTLAGYRFTKAGLLIPGSIYGSEITAYDLHINPTRYDITGIFADYEAAEAVWSDTPVYRVSSTQATTYAKLNGDLVELKDAGFARSSITSEVTDTASQWDMYTSAVRNFVKLNRAAIAAPAGHGIYPLSRPMGYLKDAKNISPLCYVQGSGALTTDADYVVLAVCSDSLICAEGVYFKTAAAYGKITERTLTGELVQTIYDANQRILTYTADSKPRHFYKIRSYLFSYSYSGTTEQLQIQDLTDKTKIKKIDKKTAPMPENIACIGDTWYCIPITGECVYKGTDPLNMTEQISLVDDEWGEYTVCNADKVGCYYADEQAGTLYVIGKSKKNINGTSNYKLFCVS